MDNKHLPESWLKCKDREEWHDHLLTHHQSEKVIWLEIKKAGSKQPGIRLSEAVEEALCFGWIDGRLVSLDSDSFLLRFTPRRPNSLWSLINRQRAEELIANNRMTEAGMASIREARANGRWQAAYSSKQPPVLPEDLAAALNADPDAFRNFANWPNNLKLQAVWWIEESQRSATRAKRIQRVIESAHKNQPLF